MKYSFQLKRIASDVQIAILVLLPTFIGSVLFCISAYIQLTTTSPLAIVGIFVLLFIFCFYRCLLQICLMARYLSVHLFCCDVTMSTSSAADSWSQFPSTCQTYLANKPDSDSDLLIILFLTAGYKHSAWKHWSSIFSLKPYAKLCFWLARYLFLCVLSGSKRNIYIFMF